MARRRNHDGVLTAPADPFSPAPAGSTADELRPDDPRQIGSYILLSRLGLGAIGPVYLGRSPGGRSVRVQVVDPGLARDPAFRLQFARDVEAASRVGGAFTAPVIDTDPDAPLPWLVTGFVPGPSLAEVVGRYGPLPVPSVLALAAGLATGLRAVHGAGLAHGGLDPASVLLAPDGPRLTGFGLSQAAGYARLVTGAAAAGFTPPEQVPGEPVGPAADMFALGAVLAFAATGQPSSGAGFSGASRDGVPGELRSPVEWCQAGNPAGRPTAEQFLAALAAAHPEATGQAGWLPVGVLARTAPPTLDFPVLPSARTTRPPRTTRVVPPSPPSPPGPPGPSVTPVPPVPAAPRPRMSRRRRTWLTAAVAVVAAAGAAAGLLAAWPRPSLEQPTGLVALSKTPWSVTLGWTASAGSVRPVGYEVLENGKRLTTVPAVTTRYQVSGLKAKTAYQFAVVAVGGNHQVPSAAISAGTLPTPPLADATFPWNGYVTYKETFSSDSYFKKLGASWQDDWQITSDCGRQACGTAMLTGAIDDIAFVARLTRSGDTYQGSAPIDDYWLDCEHQSNYEDTTLSIRIAATAAGPVYQQHWTVTAFAGSVTWDVPALPDGCASSLYKANVSGLEPVAGVNSP